MLKRAKLILLLLLSMHGNADAESCAEKTLRAIWPRHSTDVFAPQFVSYDSGIGSFLHAEASRILNSGDRNLVLQGYDFNTSPGVIIDDSGFIASYRALPNTTRRITWSNTEVRVEREIPESEIMDIRGKARRAVMDSYEDRIQPEIREAVDAVEDGLDLQHINFGVVRKGGPNGEVVGVVRMADAYVENGKIVLPALEIFRHRGMMTPEMETEVNQLMHFDPHKAGYPSLRPGVEWGQFYISKSLSASERDQVRDRLLLWIAARNVTADDTIKLLIAHNSTLAHDKIWSTAYGIDQMMVKGTKNGITERVRYTTSANYYQKLMKNITSHVKTDENR